MYNWSKAEKAQFTRRDGEIWPELRYDPEYIFYEKVTTGLSEGLCAYGYRIIEGTKIKWIKIKDATTKEE